MANDAAPKVAAAAKAQYAKSGKGKCKTCSETINKDELRIQFRSSFHHPNCLAEQKTYTKSAEEIEEFDNLEPTDQEELRNLFKQKSKA